MGLSIEPILKCYNETSLGLQLQIEASRLQSEVLGGFPEGVPSIVVNHKPDDYLSKLAFSDFRKAVCGLLYERMDTKWDYDLAQYCTKK